MSKEVKTLFTTFISDEEINEFREMNDLEKSVSDEEIGTLLNEFRYEDFNELMEELNNVFVNGFVVSGVCELWNGHFGGGKAGYGLEDLKSLFYDYDDIEIVKNPIPHSNKYKLIARLHHHDGTNCFQIKSLTEKGFYKASDEDWAHDEGLIDQLMKKNYSTYPVI